MLIDLSPSLNKDVSPYPGDPEYQQSPVATIETKGYSVHAILLNSHFGAHLDAPSHFIAKAGGIETIPLEKVYGMASCLPLGGAASLEPGSPITLKTLLPFADLFSPGAKILIQTGWGTRFGSDEYYTHAPYFSEGAIDFISGRKIDLLGFDLPSPGSYSDGTSAHRALLNSRIVILENLTNLNRLPSPPQTFCLSAAPLPIEGLDGIPVRAFAIL